MEIRKLTIPPNQEGYSVADGEETISIALQGGASWYRLDSLGATSAVNVQWTCDEDAYKYLRAFYRAATVSGSLPFKIDLYMDEPSLTEHTAHFVPKSFGLRSQSGQTFIVGATLEVEPLEVAADALLYVDLYNVFGEEWRFYAAQFDKFINYDLPSYQRNV